MPEIRIAGRIEINAGSGAAVRPASLAVSPPGTLRAWEASGSLTVDDAPAVGTYGHPVQPPYFGFELYIGGVLVPKWFDLDVQTSLDNNLQTWSVDLPIESSGIFQLGSPWLRWGPSCGLLDVDIYGVMMDGATRQVYRYPIIRRGVANVNGKLESSPLTGAVETLAGTDAGGRIDTKLVTLTVPAGSGVPRGQLQRRLLSLAGETNLMLEDGGIVTHARTWIDQDPVSAAAKEGEVEWRVLFWDRNGYARNLRVGHLASLPTSATLRPQHLNGAASLQITVPADVVTDVTLYGLQEQLVPLTQACQRKADPPQKTVREGPYAVRLAPLIQGSGGALTSTGASTGDPKVQPVEEVRTLRETACGTEVYSQVQTFGWEWPETARYTWASGEHAIPSVFCEAGATAGDQGVAHLAAGERWALTQQQDSWTYFDRIGYQGPGDPAMPWGNALQGSRDNAIAATGYRLGSIKETRTYYAIRRALKVLIPGTSWEATDPQPDVLMLGNREAVADQMEVFQLTERLVEVVSATAAGYVSSIVTYRQAWGSVPGGAYWYQGGFQSAQDVQTFMITGFSVVSYVTAGPVTVQIQETWDTSGAPKLVTRQIQTVQAAPGVERLASSEPVDSTLYGQGGSAAAGIPADPKRIKREVEDLGLELTHVKKILKTTMEDAETGAELDSAAVDIINRSAAFVATFETAAPNFLLWLGQRVSLPYPDLGIGGNIPWQVHGIEYSQASAADPPVTAFELRAYPEVV